MILVIGDIVFTAPIVYSVLLYGIICLIQPWSQTFKAIGAMIGMGAYALIPFAIAG
jgi:hypothetical protein